VTNLKTARTNHIVDGALVWDAHAGIMPSEEVDLGRLGIWRSAGVSYLSVNVGFDLMNSEQTIAVLANFRRKILSRPEEFMLAATVQDILNAKRNQKLAVTFDLEGVRALNGRIDMIEMFYALGVRQMLLAYNRNNAAGSGCHDEDIGLTAFGSDIVREMNRVGMVLDLSHTGYRTSIEAMERSEKPAVFSHSNPRSVFAHDRNIVDDQIKACAATDGVIGVVGLNRFLGDWRIDSECICDHLDYIIDLVGPRHAGLGLDYAFETTLDGMDELIAKNPEFWPANAYPNGVTSYAHPDQISEIANILLRRGHNEIDVTAILGGNFMRVAQEVWK
jgi:membrane dipeptidase